MNLGETVIIMVLKVCFYVRASLCGLHVPNIFGVRAGFDVDTSHVFPQGVLATITLIWGVAGLVGARAYTRCEVGFLLCSVAVTALSGSGSAPKFLEQVP